MNKSLLIVSIISLLIACKNEAQISKEREIVNKSIDTYGGKKFDNFEAEFDFRTHHFSLKHSTNKKGQLTYKYVRSTTDSLGVVTTDVLDNGAFQRLVNGKKITLTEKEIARYKNAVNSVSYFVLLPYKLNDAAVNLAHAGEATIDGKTYDKIKVWFDQEGGGDDHEDVYCYWFNKENQMLDYIAYANGGPRFRKATKRHNAGGLIFQDYENYAIKDTTVTTDKYDIEHAEGRDKLLSLIENVKFVVGISNINFKKNNVKNNVKF